MQMTVAKWSLKPFHPKVLRASKSLNSPLCLPSVFYHNISSKHSEISQYLNLPLTSFAKATSSVLSLKSPSRMDPTIVRPRPKNNTALSKDNLNFILRLGSQRVNVFTLDSSRLPDS